MRGIDELELSEWLVGISSWVIQDGNYPDFAVGERHSFALEFFDQNLRDADPGTCSAVTSGPARYDVTAEVAYAEGRLVLLDFGLLAYSDATTVASPIGAWRAGSVLLEVDHFAYFERHAKLDGIPRAVYPWTITGIWRQSAPFIMDPDPRRKKYVRDPTRLGYVPLDRTDAWHDDGGRADYVLRGRLESGPPTYDLTAAAGPVDAGRPCHVLSAHN